jgi:hypothetical protein
VTEIVRPGASALYDAPVYRNNLKQVVVSLQQAGKELVENGGIAQKVKNKISSDYALSKVSWRNNANFFWYRKTRSSENE